MGVGVGGTDNFPEWIFNLVQIHRFVFLSLSRRSRRHGCDINLEIFGSGKQTDQESDFFVVKESRVNGSRLGMGWHHWGQELKENNNRPGRS